MWIKFRKKYILPIKWSFTRWRMVRRMEIRPKKDLYKKKEEVMEALLKAERIDNTLDIKRLKGSLETLKWALHE